MSTLGDKATSSRTSQQLRLSTDIPPRSVTPSSQRVYPSPPTHYSYQQETSRATSPLPQSNNPYRESMSTDNNSNNNNKMNNNKNNDNASEMSVQVAGKNASTTSLNDSLKDEKRSRPKTTTFAIEEKAIAEKELEVQKQDAQDMKVKFRIRVAKCFLRCLNFGCSLVVLALLSSAFTIFMATKTLATRNNLSPWSPVSTIWPAIVALSIAGLSLTMAIVVLISYWRGGHRRAERAAIWFTAVSIGGFLLMIILWGVAAGILTNARNNSKGSDMWAWSCKDNTRKELFKDDINYDLVCRQMDWSFICAFIDISIELLSILLYAAAFYRFASKSKLRKSMDCRDQARRTLYLQKLKEGDADAYRREGDLEEGGDGYRKPTDNTTYTDGAYQPYGSSNEKQYAQPQGYSTYGGGNAPPPPASYATNGAMPIIDPNSGLEIDPVTGEAKKPGNYQQGHAM